MSVSKISTYLLICMAICSAMINASRAAEDEAKRFVRWHNSLRKFIRAPPLKWDKELAEKARKAAEGRRNDERCNEPPDNTPMDENDFCSNNANVDESITQFTHNMEWEAFGYDVVTGTCPDFYPCGPFTRIAAPETQSFGCAAVKCDVGVGTLAVCFYHPPHAPVANANYEEQQLKHINNS